MRTKFAAFAVLYFCSGCVSMPKGSSELSVDLGLKISEAKRAHYEIIDEYVAARRIHIDDYMRYAVIPRLIRNMMKEMDFDKTVCKLKGKMDRALEMQEFIEDASVEILKERTSMLNALNEAEVEWKTRIREHYARAELINNMLTSNIKSMDKMKELRNQVLDAVGAPTKKIVDLENSGKKLDKLFKR